MTHFKLKSMYRKSRFSVALLLALLLNSVCFGQTKETNNGTNFWFGFIGDWVGTSATYAVNITSFYNTNGTLTIPGIGYTTTYSVTPGVVTRLIIPAADVTYTAEGLASQAVHVTSTKNIALFYDEGYASERLDNTYVLPDTLLGNNFYVMSYCSTYTGDGTTTSEFMVATAGNSVTLQITLPPGVASTVQPAGSTYTITVNANQVYQVKGANLGDLTGTHVTVVNTCDPSQKFAIFGGNSTQGAGCNSTVDPMFEELAPTYTWGENYIFLPTPPPYVDICRILAETNGTQVSINGAVVTTLAAGAYYQTTFGAPAYISANNPISVGRILQSESCNGGSIGDPDMIMEEPNEQMFLDSITFYANNIQGISLNYLQVVTRSADIGSIELNGVLIPAANFTAVPSNNAYYYDNITITGAASPGTAYSLTTTGTGFLAYLCGLGSVVSSGCGASIYLNNISPGGTTGGVTTTTVTPTSCSACTGTATANVSGASPPFAYLWSSNAGSQTTQTATGLCKGTYTVIVAGCGTNDTTTAVVDINGVSPPSILAIPDTLCAGTLTTVSITNGAPGATYQWSNNSSSTNSSISVNPLITTTYSVSIVNNGCPPVDTSITVTVNPLPTVKASPHDTSICVGSSAVLTASGAVNYSWAPSGAGLSCTACPNPTATPSGTTMYTVTGTDAHGCASSATSTVNIVVIPPTVSLIALPKILCEGRSATLVASASNNITQPLSWQPGPFTGPSITVSPTATTVYTVTATSNCGTATDTVTITVNSIPTAEFSADITNGCAPLCVQFRDQSSTSSGKIIQWVWGYGNGDSSSEQSPIYCYSKAGNFSVNLTVLTNAGCSSSLDVNNYITTYSRPDASFTTSPKPATIVDPTIQFINQSTDRYGIVQWFWTFGDQTDSVSGQQNPVHTYQDTGTYCTTLVATNSNGCADTTTDCLVIEPAFTLYIPDAFSPNGDGKNDLFMAKGQYVKGFEMYIFDRWGQQIFHTTNINEGWSGRINNGGAVCQEDIYVYLITAYDSRNQKHTYTGSLNLIK